MSASRVTLLVTGAGGFVGRHVAAAVAAGAFGNVALAAPPDGWDIRDARAVHALVEEVRPDAVLHLAAQSFVPRAFEAPEETFDINLMGTLHLLQALKAVRFAGRFLLVSSGDVYGLVPDDALPVDERTPPMPRNPYAASKVAAEHLCLQWHRSEGLDAMVVRPFNHIGPGQSSSFVVPTLARQVAAIAAGRQLPVVDAGDIDTTRDFTDVRDVAAAYAALLAHGHSGATYVVGSGHERRIRDILATLCTLAGVAPEVRQDPARLRRADQRRMVADPRLILEHTGWSSTRPLEETLTDVLDEARTSS